MLDPAVSRVIERCLESDPHRCPSSAIQVAAALPGSDPLAAALAAGETPSPQAVRTVLYLRVGFLALVAHAFTVAVLSVMPLSFTSGSCFAGLAWLAVAVASAPALFGLYTSLAGQSVFFNAPEDR